MQNYHKYLSDKKKSVQARLEETTKRLEQEFKRKQQFQNYDYQKKYKNRLEDSTSSENSQYEDNNLEKIQQQLKQQMQNSSNQTKNIKFQNTQKLRNIKSQQSQKTKQITFKENNNLNNSSISSQNSTKLTENNSNNNNRVKADSQNDKLIAEFEKMQLDPRNYFKNKNKLDLQKKETRDNSQNKNVKTILKNKNNNWQIQQEKKKFEKEKKKENQSDDDEDLQEQDKKLDEITNKQFNNQIKRYTLPGIKRKMLNGKIVEVKDIPKPNQSIKTQKTGMQLENFMLGPTIGTGSYATVKLAVEKSSNRKVAIKIYEKYRLIDAQRKKNVQREITILSKLDNPFIIKMEKNIENHRSISLVMEFVGTTSLHQYLKEQDKRQLPEDLAKKIFGQLITALKYIHDKNIVHRDIKLENILLDDQKNIKLIDFGFAIVVNPEKKLSIFCGTPCYMAPEIVSKKEYTGGPVDMWATGILLYVMLCGHFPFKASDDKQLYEKIKKGQINYPDHISLGAQNVMEKVLNLDPSQRPTPDQILKDTWLKPIDFNQQINQIKRYQLGLPVN